jgi:hypothetical protein
MNLLPFEKIEYISGLTLVQIQEKISENIELRKNLRFHHIRTIENFKPYEGIFKHNRFIIRRKQSGIGRTNSFMPQIVGTIEEKETNIRIRVKMRLNYGIYVFFFIFFGALSTIQFFLIRASISQKEFGIVVLLPLGLMTFLYVTSLLGFRAECEKSKNDLIKFFNAQIHKNVQRN